MPRPAKLTPEQALKQLQLDVKELKKELAKQKKFNAKVLKWLVKKK